MLFRSSGGSHTVTKPYTLPTHEDTLHVAACLMLYSITVIGAALRGIVARTFYSLGDSKTPVKNGMMMVVLNATLSVFLVRVIGIKGIALGTSIASIFGCTLLTYQLRRMIGPLKAKNFLKGFCKIALISAVMIVISRFLYNYLNTNLGVFLSLMISAIFGIDRKSVV